MILSYNVYTLWIGLCTWVIDSSSSSSSSDGNSCVTKRTHIYMRIRNNVKNPYIYSIETRTLEETTDKTKTKCTKKKHQTAAKKKPTANSSYNWLVKYEPKRTQHILYIDYIRRTIMRLTKWSFESTNWARERKNGATHEQQKRFFPFENSKIRALSHCQKNHYYRYALFAEAWTHNLSVCWQRSNRCCNGIAASGHETQRQHVMHPITQFKLINSLSIQFGAYWCWILMKTVDKQLIWCQRNRESGGQRDAAERKTPYTISWSCCGHSSRSSFSFVNAVFVCVCIDMYRKNEWMNEWMNDEQSERMTEWEKERERES